MSGAKPSGDVGIGSASGSETSVTRSGVSGGAVTITDAQAQQAKTGKSPDQAVAALDTSVRTGKDSSNSLTKNWDGNQLREDVEAQAKITQAFGQQASKLIGDYADSQLKKASELRKQAAETNDTELANQLNSQANSLEKNWGNDGTARVLAHTIVGGLTGGVSGAAGAAAGTLTAPAVASALQDAGIESGLRKVLTGLASMVTGSVIGGMAGGAAAYNEVSNNFLRHAEAAALKKEIDLCRAKAGGCSDGEVTSIFQKYKNISDNNIATVQSCIIAGDEQCVKRNLTDVASASEVKVLPFGFTKSEDTLIERLNNVIGYGSVKGNASLFGTDVDQAKAVADFRKENCEGMPVGACDSLVKDAINYRMLRMAALSAVAGATPALVAQAKKLIVSGSKPSTITPDLDRYTADQDLPNVYKNQGAKGVATIEPVVTAKGTVNGAIFEDVNQTAKVGVTNEPTLIADRIATKVEVKGKPFPNGTVADSHAEIGVIQQAYSAGKTQGAERSMVVTGKNVCGFCKGDIAAAADAAGLKSLTVQAIDDLTRLPKNYYWQPGMKSIKEKP